MRMTVSGWVIGSRQVRAEDAGPVGMWGVSGDTVKIGAWLAKAHTKHRCGRLLDDRARLIAALFDGVWTTEAAVPA
ncbi:hypothetical protein AB0A94_35420 [Streptomyces sp. NPDC044984]|uniref:hypothetical protein n=1 Tax=Streptomyces sp. NPDC044984 TaxID=3154335 RepID=UPI0033FBB980